MKDAVEHKGSWWPMARLAGPAIDPEEVTARSVGSEALLDRGRAGAMSVLRVGSSFAHSANCALTYKLAFRQERPRGRNYDVSRIVLGRTLYGDPDRILCDFPYTLIAARFRGRLAWRWPIPSRKTRPQRACLANRRCSLHDTRREPGGCSYARWEDP